MKNQKGITLVALIITIVVMLILVAVSVGIIVNSNLISESEKAGNAYEASDDKTETLGTDNIIGNNTKSVNSYLQEAMSANS